MVSCQQLCVNKLTAADSSLQLTPGILNFWQARLVLQWAETTREHWPNSIVEKQSVRQWDQWATLKITPAIQRTHYTFWRTHAAFTDVLATGGPRKVRPVSFPSPATGSSPATAGTAVMRRDKRTLKHATNIPPSNKVKVLLHSLIYTFTV